MSQQRIVDHTGAVIFTEKVTHETSLQDYFILPTGEKYRRPLGRLLTAQRILIVERDSCAPVHQRHEGYHLNKHILLNYPGGPEFFDRIALVEVDTKNVYLVDVLTVYAEAQPAKIHRDGLASQVFIYREWLQHYPIPPNGSLIAAIRQASPHLKNK